jgi:flagellar biosynthesis/type III secretory pathway protein FliH
MAAKSKAAKAGSAALAVKSSPYVQRLMQDEELRDNLKTAFDSARSAIDRLGNGKPPAKVILDDKKFQKELHNASEALRDAAQALREGPKKKKRRGRKLLLLVVAAGLALALSEGLRNKVLDLLFGAEEEFDYTSTTAPASSPPSPAPTAS